ncbi:MAG: phage major capsid protein, partial [Desulfofundulus sp.]
MNLQELKQRLGNLCDQQQTIVDRAVAEARPLTEEEKKQFNDLQAQIDGLNETIKAAEAVQARADNLNKTDGKPFRPMTDPAIDSGYRQQNKLDDGGFKTLGEFVHAVRFGDPKGRLQNLPQGQGQGGGIEVPDAFKAQIMPWRFYDEWRMDEGTSGGFAVPVQFRQEMLMIKPEAAIVRPRATVIPAGDPPDSMVTVPAFRQGANGVLGGVEVYWISEGAEKPETGGELRE